MEAVKRGGDRQVLHEVIRECALAAWAALKDGRANPLIESLMADNTLLGLMDEPTIRSCLNADDYVGDAPARARQLAQLLRTAIEG